MTDLPTDIDTAYADNAADPSAKLHQQYHDDLHALRNAIIGAAPDPASVGLASVEALDNATSGVTANRLYIDDPAWGVVGDGVTDDGPAIQAAINSLAGAPCQVIFGTKTYGTTNPIVFGVGQELCSTVKTVRGVGAEIKALAGFTGAAVIKSVTYDNGDYIHAGGLSNLIVSANGVAACGILLHAVGEEFFCHRVAAFGATEAAWKFTGNHAVGHLEDVSGWVNTAGAVAFKFTAHPTRTEAVTGDSGDGNGGVVRIIGLSGDNGNVSVPGNADSLVYVDGDHTLTLVGVKSELHTTVLTVAGASIARVFMTGDAIRQSPAAGQLVHVQGTARPTIVLDAMRANQYLNIVKDDVKAITVAAPTTGPAIDHLVWSANPTHAVSRFFAEMIGQASATGKGALRLRRFSAGSTASTLAVEDEAGNPLWEIGPDGKVIQANNIGFYIENASGTARRVVLMSAGGNVHLGDVDNFQAAAVVVNAGDVLYLRRDNVDFVRMDAQGVKVSPGGTNLGFYGATPVAKQTGVAVTAAGIHAALVALGLIAP